MRLIAAVTLAMGMAFGAGAGSGAAADRVSWHVVASGGVVGSAAGTHRVSASAGQTAVDVLWGATYQVFSGFWNSLLIGPVGAEDGPHVGLPQSFGLTGNRPNPFGSETSIRYAVPRHSHVTIEVYNLAGHRVRTLSDGARETGYHYARWDCLDDRGCRAGSGVYLARMRAQFGGRAFQQSRPMLIVR